jgi:hypothetical protein
MALRQVFYKTGFFKKGRGDNAPQPVLKMFKMFRYELLVGYELAVLDNECAEGLCHVSVFFHCDGSRKRFL